MDSRRLDSPSEIDENPFQDFVLPYARGVNTLLPLALKFFDQIIDFYNSLGFDSEFSGQLSTFRLKVLMKIKQRCLIIDGIELPIFIKIKTLYEILRDHLVESYDEAQKRCFEFSTNYDSLIKAGSIQINLNGTTICNDDIDEEIKQRVVIFNRDSAMIALMVSQAEVIKNYISKILEEVIPSNTEVAEVQKNTVLQILGFRATSGGQLN